MPPISLSPQSLRAQAGVYLRQMDWARGLRAGLALCAPLVLGDLFPFHDLAWASLGGLMAIAADSGGAYRTRLSSLIICILGGGSGILLGSLVAGHLVWALPAVLFFCFLWNYLAVLGEAFASAHIVVQVLFFATLGQPVSSPDAIFHRAALVLAGNLWAVLLALFFWPLDAYRPVRIALSACYEEIAAFLGAMGDMSGNPGQTPAEWHELSLYHPARIRRAIEEGWRALAAVHSLHSTESGQGQQSVVLLELADLLVLRSVALAEHLEFIATGGDASCRDRGLTGIDQLSSASQWIASLLQRRRGQTQAMVAERLRQMEQLPGFLSGCLAQGPDISRFLLAQFTEFAALFGTAVESAALLRLGKSSGRAPARSLAASVSHFGYVYGRISELRQSFALQTILDQLAANFNFRSLTLRHALRVSLVCGIDIVISSWLRIGHGSWLLLTSLLVLQPHISGTLRRGVQRIGGTVAGAVLAALLAVSLHAPMTIASVIFLLAVLSMAVRPVSYTAFAFFITPTIILDLLPYPGDWQLALVRVAVTIAGSAIAVVAMLIFFPVYERERSPAFVRASLEANRRYLKLLAESWSAGPAARSRRPLANARRAAGLAHCDTEESLERMVAETWTSRQAFSHFAQAFLAYLRRFGQSVTTLSTLEGDWDWKRSSFVLTRLHLLDLRLQWLFSQIGSSLEHSSTDSSAPPWPNLPATDYFAAVAPDSVLQSRPGEHQIERLQRQTDVLRRELLALRGESPVSG